MAEDGLFAFRAIKTKEVQTDIDWIIPLGYLDQSREEETATRTVDVQDWSDNVPPDMTDEFDFLL